MRREVCAKSQIYQNFDRMLNTLIADKDIDAHNKIVTNDVS